MSKTNFTVAELIAELQKLPQDIPVVVSGYESGFEGFYQPIVKQVIDNPEQPWYEGRFQIDYKGDLEVVILMRENRDD